MPGSHRVLALGRQHLAGDEVEADDREDAERDQRRPDVVGGARVGVRGQRQHAAGDQPQRAEQRQHATRRQQQLGDEEGDAEQGDDDEDVHAPIIRSRNRGVGRARSA